MDSIEPATFAVFCRVLAFLFGKTGSGNSNRRRKPDNKGRHAMKKLMVLGFAVATVALLSNGVAVAKKFFVQL